MAGVLVSRHFHGHHSALMSLCTYIELQIYETYLAGPLDFNTTTGSMSSHTVLMLQQQ